MARKPHCRQCGKPMAGHTRPSNTWVCPEPSEDGDNGQSDSSSPLLLTPRDKGKQRAREADEEMEDDTGQTRSNTRESQDRAEGGRDMHLELELDQEGENGGSFPMDQDDDDENHDPSDNSNASMGQSSRPGALAPMSTMARLFRNGGHWRNPNFIDEAETSQFWRLRTPSASSEHRQSQRVAFADITPASDNSESENTSYSDDFQSTLGDMLLRPYGELEHAFREFAQSFDPRASIFKIPLSGVDRVRTAATNVGLHSGVLEVFVKEEDEDGGEVEKEVSIVIGQDPEAVDNIMDMHRASQCSVPQIVIRSPQSRPDLRYDALLSAGALGGLAAFGCLFALTGRA